MRTTPFPVLSLLSILFTRAAALHSPLGASVLMSASSMPPGHIDTHLHVWRGAGPYAEGQTPPLHLQERGTVEALLDEMRIAEVAGCVIVQPIAHKFDHSYVSSCMKKYPHHFKGVCLLNPQSPDPVKELEDYYADGFTGVRFNPGLWPPNQSMDDDVGRAVFTRAGELGMPVEFLCFKGLATFSDTIEALMAVSPSTTVIIEHWGFFKQDEASSEHWKELTEMALCPQVYVKLSAHFRVSSADAPYPDLAPRFGELLDAYGSKRLMWGSDFPFVLDNCTYKEGKNALKGWIECLSKLELEEVMGGTARRVFGEWPAADA